MFDGTTGSAPSRAFSGGWVTVAFTQLLLATLLLRLLWLDQPPGVLIFDESYYVNAARVILGWPVPEGAHYAAAPAGLDPNREHFPLGKLIIAGSMLLFGDNAVGWRLPNVLMGTASVGLLFLIVRRLTDRAGLALLAAFVLSFDSLFYVHSRIATLDMPMVFLQLLGLYLYVAHGPVLAGVALALSALAKVTGIYGLGALLLYEGLRFLARQELRRAWRPLAANVLMLGGSFLVTFLLVLWPMDRTFATYDDPVQHVAFVYGYGVNLTSDRYPSDIESAPWQWLVNQVPIPYLKVSENVVVEGKVVASRPVVNFVGQINPYVVGLLPLALAYLLAQGRRRDTTLPLFLLALLAATYLPSLATSLLFNRTSYIFYFLPVLPGLAAAIAYLLTGVALPRGAVLAYLAAVLLGFALSFPFRIL